MAGKRTARIAGGLAAAVLLGGLGGGWWVRHRLVESLPETAGELPVAGLSAPVTIERDAQGIPTLRGADRRDVAFATGFVHAQDRFFQMDLLRRRSAGELAELLGPAALPNDEAMRRHLFRVLARRVLAAATPEVRGLLNAYTDGTNAGLRALDAPPFEYGVLRMDPAPWKAEDSVLVWLTLFTQLEDVNGTTESVLSLMHDRLQEPLFRFLNPPPATEWEAPIAGTLPAAVPVPGPEVMDLRSGAALLFSPLPAGVWEGDGRGVGGEGRRAAGSNSWAVAGGWTAGGGALLANELHLGLALPNVWYRAVLAWPSRRLVGVTLPGTPVLMVGSNGEVAWGVTNSVLDTGDLILLDVDPQDPSVYRTPQGPRRFTQQTETLAVRGEPSREIEVEQTVWGPVIGTDWHGRKRAIRTVTAEPGAVDFSILRLETASGVEAALDIARSSGVPALNFLAADRAGRIGWTVAGRLPRRAGFDGEVASSWSDGTRRWEGLVPPDEVPRVIDPPSGRLWTANNLVLAGEGAVARGNFLLGARARQIRDGLLALPRATADDMRRLQLDDRALFLERWRGLLLRVLTPQAVAADPRRGELRALVERWGGRAAVGSAGYRMVRVYRWVVARAVLTPLLAACRAVDPELRYVDTVNQYEAPLWQLVTQRPLHLLDPQYKSWDEQLLAAADQVIALLGDQGPLAERTWGERNTTAIEHPLSAALPLVGSRLALPPRQLPGDDDMPRVQAPDFGATLRMVVSPGREEEGILQMPGGESGNPISEHYDDLYDAWATGAAAPLLPGKAVGVLRLVPRKAP
jgi:penicillin amidase